MRQEDLEEDKIYVDINELLRDYTYFWKETSDEEKYQYSGLYIKVGDIPEETQLMPFCFYLHSQMYHVSCVIELHRAE